MNQGVHRVDSAVPMPSRDYLPYVLSLIDRVERVVLATVFIIDPRPETDLSENVRLLLDTLARAHWRGVDVRVIVGNSSQTPAIELADRVARRYLEGLGVPCRPYAGGGAYGSLHSKYLVVDDVAVVGSHNWSHQALCLDDELSLAVRSKDLSAELRAVFERDWERAAPRGDEAGGAPASAPAPKPGPQTGPEGSAVRHLEAARHRRHRQVPGPRSQAPCRSHHQARSKGAFPSQRKWLASSRTRPPIAPDHRSRLQPDKPHRHV